MPAAEPKAARNPRQPQEPCAEGGPPFRRTFLLCFAFRVANACLLRTAFNPDETWQSLEVAHKLVFGHGYLPWEWEPCVALRAHLPILPVVVLYRFLAAAQLDSALAVCVASHRFKFERRK